MAWIETVGEDEAQGHLADLYEAHGGADTGRVAHILRVQSLHPKALEAHYALYREVVLKPTRTLRRADREMIGVVVSRVNECHY